MKTRYRVIFIGRVQGVGFRYTLASFALEYNLVGFCRNLDSGDVELEIEGDEYNVDAFLDDVLKKKHMYVIIEDYHLKKIPLKEESSFRITY